MSHEQPTLFDYPQHREAVIAELNAMTERKWDLIDELAAVELGRTALIMMLRGEE